MDFIGLTKEAEDYLHLEGQVMTYTYAVELSDGNIVHLRGYRHHHSRIPITCSVGGGLVEVLQEYVCGYVCTCLVHDPGWGGVFPGLAVPPFTRVHAKMRYDSTLKTYKITEPIDLQNAMFKWKRELRGEQHPMWTLNSETGILPNAWFPPELSDKEGGG